MSLDAMAEDMRRCSAGECDRKVYCRGWCTKHYQRWRRHGDPLVTLIPWTDMSIDERMWSRVSRSTDGCWEWTGSRTPDGYGNFRVKGRHVLTHRVAYELMVGPIPEGLQLDHLCRNRACCNPDHLEPVTRRVNILRGTAPSAVNAAKTHCVNGHQLGGSNLYVSPVGGRGCRICRYAAVLKWRASA